jgi:accessory Sec system glycosylation protein GtfA
VTIEDVLATIGQPHGLPQTGPDHVDVALAGSGVRYRIRTLTVPVSAAGTGATTRVVDRVETLVGDQVVRVEHYDETLNNVEHFHEGRLVRRVFHAPDGTVAAEQFYRDQEITRTVITPASPLHEQTSRSFRGDVVLEGRSQFFQHVLRHLLTRPDDVVIVDRALDVIDAVYPVIGEHRLYSVVHAEHFDLKQVDDGILLWNNHYEHVFSRPDLLTGFIVSTHRQQETLTRQLASRGVGRSPDDAAVVCIPAGVVAAPVAHPEYERLSLVTASRLADEKHIDVLIRAVAEARRTLPGLRFDIYGEGNREPLLAVIAETGTQDCVRLMGHQRLSGVLGSYALYVSASTSEGFGLSLLEAMAEGLPIVGFDVDYGNREMVEPGVNGLLLPCTRTDGDATSIAGAIVEVLTSEGLDEMRAASLRRAEAYTAANVRTLWQRLLLGEAAC